MTSKKLGALLRSVPPATAVAPQETAGSVEAAAYSGTGKTVAVVEAEVPLQVLIPAGVRKQLALKAAEEGQSLRALVLQAIRSLGITVTDADIKGKRGRNNS
jgi:hypothetical protein